MPLALATSLATIIITSISSILAHQKRKAILWPLFKILTPAILLGAFFGGVFASRLPSNVLQVLFAIYAMLVSLQLFFGTQPAIGSKTTSTGLHLLSGLLIGGISSIVGIGGGSMTVPYLIWNSIPLRSAVATSSAIGLPIAIAGTAGYISSSYQLQSLPDSSLGFVYLPAFFSIIITSYLFAPAGAKLAHQLPLTTLKKFFAILMLIIGLKMLLTL